MAPSTMLGTSFKGYALRWYNTRQRLKWAGMPKNPSHRWMKITICAMKMGFEMDRLQPVLVDKSAEECPHGKAKSLLVEGPEDDSIGPILRGELRAVAALPPGDRLLWEEAVHLHVL
jgi:hypothetical protein